VHARPGLTRRARWAGVLTAVVGGALGIAACDSGSDQLSQRELVRRASAVCRGANERVERIEAPSLADPDGVGRAIGEVVVIQRRALADLRELEPPTRDEPGYDGWLRDLDAALDQMSRARAALGRGDRPGADAATLRARERGDAAETFAAAYGLDACSTTDEQAPGPGP